MAENSRTRESYFLRRLAAFVLDLFILGLLIDLGTAAYSRTTGNFTAPVLPLPFRTVCTPGQLGLDPDPPVDLSTWQHVYICEKTHLLHGSVKFALLANVEGSGRLRKTENLTLGIRDDGTLHATIEYTAMFLPLLVCARVIALEALFAAGPGKKMLGLRVTALHGSGVGLRRSLIRNIVRLLPLLMSPAINLLGITYIAAVPDSRLYGPGQQIGSAPWILALLLPLIAAIAVWVAPFLRARSGAGLMLHNHAAQTRVVRLRNADLPNETNDA